MEKIEELKKKINYDFETVIHLEELNELKVKYLGKKGLISELNATIKDLPKEEKKSFGQAMNEVKVLFQEKYLSLKTKLEEEKVKEKLESERIDITLPSTKIRRGSKHPMSLAIEEIEDLFVSMGYDVVSGPELESDEYCFERLNLPKGHPARDMQDSFYITPDYLLRTQTSSVQARYMMEKQGKEPIRIIVPGKTYRREDDATHAPQFSQIEGLVIDKKENHVSLADLKGTLEVFARHMLGSNLDLRFRPSYFPFTEPSYEVDVTCFKCHGKGCSLCKQIGWIEVFAAGMVMIQKFGEDLPSDLVGIGLLCLDMVFLIFG